jgi:putative membrane protein
MMMWFGNGMGWGGWMIGGLVSLAFWAFVVFGAVALFRSGSLGGSRPEQRTPEQILDERFARGEIDVEEYTRRHDLLRAGSAPRS